MHMAGHYAEADGFLIDTHGADIIDPVWALLGTAFESIGPSAADIPVCLERDFNFPPLAELLAEMQRIRSQQEQYRAMPRLTA
jgi:uncharacterized protein (UPF0276 family)